jgi:hypothetical protein
MSLDEITENTLEEARNLTEAVGQRLKHLDEEVLLTVREIYIKDRTVLEADCCYLAQELKYQGYPAYLPTLWAVGAAQDALIDAECILGIA